MRIFSFFVLLHISFAVKAQPDFKPAPFSDWNGKSFPFQDWVTIKGDSIKQSSLVNKVCFLYFFANGCAGCVLESKYMNRLSKYYSDSADVRIIGLYSGNKDSFEKYNRSNEIITKASSNSSLQLKSSMVSVPKYPIIPIDPNQFTYKYNAWGIPSNMIIDKLGIVRYCSVGFPPEKSVQEKILLEYISEIEKLRK